MEDIKNIFIKKKILIYGLGKSGLSSYYFLKKNNNLYLYDDDKKVIKDKKIKKIFIRPENIFKNNFDFIVISPGININKCSLKNFLKKNLKKIITDLDIFYSHYFKNRNIAITGTNGKSTTAKILFDILKNQKFDVRLTGNIGNPILSEKKITSKTIFVIEASSYQIEYSKKFKANYALILNISPDHLERHGTFINYVKSKFKLFSNQTKQDYSFFDIKNKYLKKEIKKSKIYSQIIKVDTKSINKHIRRIKNPYFLTKGHQNNLAFIFAIIKEFGLKKTNLFKVINNFKGLKYRQQIIYQSKELTLINDSKATSYSSSINILKSLKKVFWIVGGVPKFGDQFFMTKKDCINFKVYIYGKNKNHFIKQLKNKIDYQSFNNLKDALKKIIFDIKREKKNEDKTILFSPSAASFDSFKNFEDRGKKFNTLVKKLNLKKLINA
jgi:UDP-N-acetylmuramoylalanine--D-glutamate ligase